MWVSSLQRRREKIFKGSCLKIIPHNTCRMDPKIWSLENKLELTESASIILLEKYTNFFVALNAHASLPLTFVLLPLRMLLFVFSFTCTLQHSLPGPSLAYPAPGSLVPPEASLQWRTVGYKTERSEGRRRVCTFLLYLLYTGVHFCWLLDGSANSAWRTLFLPWCFCPYGRGTRSFVLSLITEYFRIPSVLPKVWLKLC